MGYSEPLTCSWNPTPTPTVGCCSIHTSLRQPGLCPSRIQPGCGPSSMPAPALAPAPTTSRNSLSCSPWGALTPLLPFSWDQKDSSHHGILSAPSLGSWPFQAEQRESPALQTCVLPMQGQDGQQGGRFQLLTIFNCSFPERLVQSPKAASSWEFGKLVPVRRPALAELGAVIFRRAEGNSPTLWAVLSSGHGSWSPGPHWTLGWGHLGGGILWLPVFSGAFLAGRDFHLPVSSCAARKTKGRGCEQWSSLKGRGMEQHLLVLIKNHPLVKFEGVSGAWATTRPAGNVPRGVTGAAHSPDRASCPTSCPTPAFCPRLSPPAPSCLLPSHQGPPMPLSAIIWSPHRWPRPLRALIMLSLIGVPHGCPVWGFAQRAGSAPQSRLSPRTIHSRALP